MIRQRVDFSGNVRGLEPAEQLPACTMPLAETGMIKEGPAMRYIEGQAKWDRKFHRVKKRVARHRKRNLKKAKEKDATRIMKNWDTVGESMRAAMPVEATPAADRGHHGHHHHGHRRHSHGHGEPTELADAEQESDEGDQASISGSSLSSSEISGGDDMDMLGGTWGWALNGEAPPPSAIVSRRDIVSCKFLLRVS